MLNLDFNSISILGYQINYETAKETLSELSTSLSIPWSSDKSRRSDSTSSILNFPLTEENSFLTELSKNQKNSKIKTSNYYNLLNNNFSHVQNLNAIESLSIPIDYQIRRHSIGSAARKSHKHKIKKLLSAQGSVSPNTMPEIIRHSSTNSSIPSSRPSDFGQDTDSETNPLSDAELAEPVTIEPEVSSLLLKMEELNKIIETDARSVISHKSGSLSSELNTETNSPTRSSSGSCRQNSCHLDDDDNIDLWTVWGNLVKNWDHEMKKRPNDVKDLVRRGIPQHFRTITWQLLCKANSNNLHDIYTDYLRQHSPYEKVIMRDIPRTYPELKFFKEGGRGQPSLFNVIKAYSIHDKEVGYCQGSAFIVGQLLLQMPEEEAFAVFVKLMEDYRLRELYKPTMTDLGLCMFQLECLVQDQMSDLYTHFNNMGFDTSMYASSWFLTLFTTSLPLDLANRIMDFFLVDGMEAIFRIAMAILQQARFDLLRLDMEGMLKYFQRDIKERYENDHDLLFTVACQITLNAKKMKKLEKEYMTKRSKEQEEAIELRRLRTENRLLRQRIDYLEQESSALADRLIRGQVDLAQKSENCLNISHELNILRDINSNAHKKLEEAFETIRELSSRPKNENIICEDKSIQVDDTTMIEHIHQLQQELIETHTKKSELENCIRECKLRLQEVELANKRLREQPPDDGIAGLQEELISVKMREAEASLSLKEMRQRFAELEQQWAKYVHARTFGAQALAVQSFDVLPKNDDDSGVTNSPEGVSPSTNGQSSTPSNQQPTSARARLANLTAKLMGAGFGYSGEESNDTGMSMKEMEDQLMGLRIREADAVAELKEMRQKVMELETQNHVCTNQLKRQDEELKKVLAECEHRKINEKESAEQLKEEQRKSIEVQSELKEKAVMQRLKYTEALNSIAELKQQIAHYESMNAEKMACAQLRGTSVCDLDDDSNGSHKSYNCNGDAGSLASEEMSALISDVTIKIPEFILNEKKYFDSDEDGTESEEKIRRPLRKTEICKVDCNLTNTETNKFRVREDENDTTDSGLNLSDN
uniref:Rab-GAP TBC domain-containing protein n=1 Tax=Parastrongyloides trichosuri TaxID=131310 RepID=A0A0N4ZT62_PARTI